MALSRDEFFRTADEHLRRDEVEKAIALYRAWLGEHPDDGNTWRVVGDLCVRLGQTADAARCYHRVADSERVRSPRRAIALYKLILKLDPRDGKALEEAANMLEQEGRIAEARAFFEALEQGLKNEGRLAEAEAIEARISAMKSQPEIRASTPDRTAPLSASMSLGEALVKEGLVSAGTPATLRQGADAALRAVIEEQGLVKEDELLPFLSRFYGTPSVDLKRIEVDRDVLALVSPETAGLWGVLPLSVRGNTLTVAVSDPSNVFLLDDLRFVTGHDIEPRVASIGALKARIQEHYGEPAPPARDASRPPARDPDIEERVAGNGPRATEYVTEPFVRLFAEAERTAASELYLEPGASAHRVRARVDGELRDVLALSEEEGKSLIRRLDRLAPGLGGNLRTPWESGPFSVGQGTSKYRLAVVPTSEGTLICVKRLEQGELPHQRSHLPASSASAPLKVVMQSDGGLSLFTGPHGAGKTRGLSAALAFVADFRAAFSAARPVDFELREVDQLSPRSWRVEEPDVLLSRILSPGFDILAFEDAGTWEVAGAVLRAAISVPVLATLESDDAVNAIQDLLQVRGPDPRDRIHPEDVAEVLECVVAGRLVRRVCEQCKAPYRDSLEDVVELGFSREEAEGLELLRGTGCPSCEQTGYRGRVGILEVLEVDDALRDGIARGVSSAELRVLAGRAGMVPLQETAMQALRDNVTTPDEIRRLGLRRRST
jgi:type IV pilus assembly protein PilB